ncbi:MAG: NTP transferase domain-containing protein [Acidimicrobiales bacterium]
MTTATDTPTLVVLAAGLARRYGGLKPLAPIGPHGEAVIDLVASDARAAGFGRIVLVLHPETGPAVRYHVERCWPESVPVAFAVQRVPLGTTHAVLAARETIGGGPFAVANADDVYGQDALSLLARHLQTEQDEHALVAFSLAATVVSDAPVTRGVCTVAHDGTLSSIAERRHVARHRDRGTEVGFRADDGASPVDLSPDAPVSVNLWGFQADIWSVFTAAMDASGLDEEEALAMVAAGRGAPTGEVLLPEVVGRMVADGQGLPVRVLRASGACIGVTHADDLPVVRDLLARQVATGERPEWPWEPLPAA